MMWKSPMATMTVLLVVSRDLTSSHDSREIESLMGQPDHNASIHPYHRVVRAAYQPVRPKVAGGTTAYILDFPWQVLLLDKGDPVCGGSIISDNWVLTAAHCLPVDEVMTGSDKVSSGGMIHKIAKQKKHRKYSSKSEDYDIAVIKVKTPFKFNTKSQPVEKLATVDPAAGTRVTVSGWGKTSDKAKKYPNHLRKVTVAIVEHSICKKAYGRDLTRRMICAASKGKDACQGDSGGPLVKEKTSELVGIVSFGDACASSKYPGVYTSVAAFRKWIKRKTNV